MRLLLSALWLIQFAAGADLQSTPIAYVTGNGGLTAGIDAHGGLVQLRWPGPGGLDHVAAPAPAGRGTGWYILEGTTWLPLGGAGWSVRSGYTGSDSLVLSTHFEAENESRLAVQRVFVWPERDVLAVTLRLTGFDPDTRVAWYQNLAPSTRQVTGYPPVQGRADHFNDFAAWYDADAAVLVHFRPDQPGRADWDRARALAGDSGARPDWPAFGPGAYFTTVSPQPVLAAAAAPVSTPVVARDLDKGTPPHAAAGRVHAWLELQPAPLGPALEAAVLVGAGETGEASRASALAARETGAPALRLAAEEMGPTWLKGARAAARDPAHARTVLDLLLCIDQASGAVLRAPLADPPEAYAAVFDTAWASAALDGLGYTGAAARALQFHLDTVRGPAGDGLPAGSLPATATVAGNPARYAGNADPEAAAWLLAACWRHAQMRPPAAGEDYLAGVWPVLQRSAVYLAREPRAGRALSSGQPAPDVPLALLKTHYLGLECARRIAERLGEAEPGVCADRREEIYSRIRFRVLNGEGGADAGTPWISWWVGQLAGLGEAAASGWDVIAGPEQVPPLGTDAAGLDWGGRATVPRALPQAIQCLNGPAAKPYASSEPKSD